MFDEAGRGARYRMLRQLRFRALRDARTHLAGAYRSAFHGAGLKFDEFTPYRCGDDVRRIDWLVTARRQAPYVKRFAEERRLRLIVGLDVSRSMDAVSRRSVELAALLLMCAAAGRDLTGAVVWGARRPHTIAPRSGIQHATRILQEALSTRDPADATDLRPALRQLLHMKRSVVVLISDFLLSPPLPCREVRRLLSACALKHDVLAVRLLQPLAGPERPRAVIEVVEAESGRPLKLDGAGRTPASEEVGTLRRCGVRTCSADPKSDVLATVAALLRGQAGHRFSSERPFR